MFVHLQGGIQEQMHQLIADVVSQEGGGGFSLASTEFFKQSSLSVSPEGLAEF